MTRNASSWISLWGRFPIFTNKLSGNSFLPKHHSLNFEFFFLKDFGVLAVNNYYIILLIFLCGMYNCDGFFNLKFRFLFFLEKHERWEAL